MRLVLLNAAELRMPQGSSVRIETDDGDYLIRNDTGRFCVMTAGYDSASGGVGGHVSMSFEHGRILDLSTSPTVQAHAGNGGERLCHENPEKYGKEGEHCSTAHYDCIGDLADPCFKCYHCSAWIRPEHTTDHCEARMRPTT